MVKSYNGKNKTRNVKFDCNTSKMLNLTVLQIITLLNSTMLQDVTKLKFNIVTSCNKMLQIFTRCYKSLQDVTKVF